MKINIIVSLAILFTAFSVHAADVKISKKLPLYGEAKYADNFKHFDYASEKAVKGGRIVLPAYGGYDNFNPFIFKGIAATEVADLTLDSLGVVPKDDISTVYPLIAKEFEIPSDNSFVGFILDKNAKFHNGTPITADDVIYSFKAVTEQGAPIYKVYYGDVEKVERVNDHHLRFIFKKGADNKELPLILSQLKIFSKKSWEGKDFSKPELKPFLGNGPYKVSKFEPGKYIVLERVKDYWAQNLPSRKGFYNFDEIRYDYYQDTTVTLQALFSGNIDARMEYIAKIWVTGYDNDVVKKGKVIKEEMEHNEAATLQNFAFNLRRPMFADKRVRQAIGLAFNFEWANEKLFYGQYKRLYSYFTNTGMEATGLPEGKELKLLNKFRKDLAPEVFTQAPILPLHRDYKESRENLRQAVKLLQEAGYDFKDGKMTNLQTGETIKFEVLSNSANGSTFTRVMLPFINNLKKIGIEVTFRNLEVNIFKNRLDNFDFDVAILSFGVSQMPGNEQKEMWGSQSANVKGSYNMMGIQNPVVDALVQEVIKAKHKDDYIAAVKALDRVLLNEHYMIPQWYSPYHRIAYRDKFQHPQTNLKVGFQPFTWWMKEGQK